MLSRIGHFMRFSTQVQPPAAWLPPELISNILVLIIEEDAAANQFFVGLARMCRGWYLPVREYIYGNAAPASVRSCELLIRSLDNDPQLSFLLKSLTVPQDARLFAVDTLSVREPTLLQKLVGKCPHLVELRIPMNSAFMWTSELLQTKLPSMRHLSNLRSLEISAFNAVNPSHLRDITAEYVSMWLFQVPSLPHLERLTLSGVAFSARSYCWPSLPRLRYLWLNRPWCSLGDTIPLLSHVSGSLKSLRVTGLSETGSYEATRNRLETTLISSHAVSSTLEELIIISQRPIFILPDLWLDNGLEHMTSLRRLHISSWFYDPRLLTKVPPLLENLVITMHGEVGSVLNIRTLLRLLSSTAIKSLVIMVRGYIWVIDPSGVVIASPSLYHSQIEEKGSAFRGEIYQFAQDLGINFRIEKMHEPSGFRKRSMSRWKRTMKFFKKSGLSL